MNTQHQHTTRFNPNGHETPRPVLTRPYRTGSAEQQRRGLEREMQRQTKKWARLGITLVDGPMPGWLGR